jgi:hypothetical protein
MGRPHLSQKCQTDWHPNSRSMATIGGTLSWLWGTREREMESVWNHGFGYELKVKRREEIIKKIDCLVGKSREMKKKLKCPNRLPSRFRPISIRKVHENRFFSE